MKNHTRIVMQLLLGILLTGSTLVSAQIQTGFLDRSLQIDGEEYRYQVYLPRDYEAVDSWPVILFLHGGGERGADGLKQTQVGLGGAVRLNPERWPAIVVFPQAPEDEIWQGETAERAIEALDATLQEFSTDESRIYLTGMSLGGNGTWYLGYHHTERFAAMVAICSFVGLDDRIPDFLPNAENPYAEVAARVADKPVWIVHGDTDVVVPVEESRRMYEELQAVDAEVNYTELPGVNHNSWDPAYADESLIQWLFSQSL